MSHPIKRYAAKLILKEAFMLKKPGQIVPLFPVEDKDGIWVSWDDCVDLAAENKRLRKAGDAMDDYLKRQDGTTNGMLPCREAWLAAKEGTSK